MTKAAKRLLLILALGAACFGQTFSNRGLQITKSPWHAETRTVELPGHFYLVEYEISDSGFVSIPAVFGGQDKPHHRARVSVFEIVDGVRRQIGATFDGQYVDGGCFEDEPGAMIEAAYGSVPRDVKEAIEARRTKAQFEAQPLFQQEIDGSLTITTKGERDLKEVRIGGRVVWSNPNGCPSCSTTMGTTTISGTTTTMVAHQP